MIGAIIGDVVGSRFEFQNHLSKKFDFFAPGCEFTDDTVMTCAVAQALLDCDGDYTHLYDKAVSAMQRIGQAFPNAGYGARFVYWVFADKPKPYNSYGNGSAMRISPVGFAATSMEEVRYLAGEVTRVSHNHPEGMKGAEATAAAIFLAREGRSKQEIRRYIEDNYYALDKSVDDYYRKWNGHGAEICQISVPQALTCFLEGEDYEDVIRNCISIGGDSDTIAAIAGGIAEAYFGVPENFRQEVRSYLDPSLVEITDAFREKFMGTGV